MNDGVDVRVWTLRGPVELSSAGDIFYGEIMVPDDAVFGDLLTVEVIGRDGEVIAQNRTFIQGTEVVLEVRLVKDIDDQTGTQFLIPAAFLGVCAIAVAFYVSDRMRRGKEEV